MMADCKVYVARFVFLSGKVTTDTIFITDGLQAWDLAEGEMLSICLVEFEIICSTT